MIQGEGFHIWTIWVCAVGKGRVFEVLDSFCPSWHWVSIYILFALQTGSGFKTLRGTHYTQIYGSTLPSGENDPIDIGSFILIWIITKERTLLFALIKIHKKSFLTRLLFRDTTKQLSSFYYVATIPKRPKIRACAFTQLNTFLPQEAIPRLSLLPSRSMS